MKKIIETLKGLIMCTKVGGNIVNSTKYNGSNLNIYYLCYKDKQVNNSLNIQNFPHMSAMKNMYKIGIITYKYKNILKGENNIKRISKTMLRE